MLSEILTEFNRVITTLIYRNKVYKLSETLTKFNRVKTFIKLLKIYLLHNLVRVYHALKKSNIFKMAELIFQEVW